MSIDVVFIGMPGSGKTTVGKLVAQILGVDFHDSDHLIEQHTEMSIAEIFRQKGDDGFRDIEADVIADALRNCDGVLSLGGGAVLREETRRALEGYRVFFIDVSPEELARRVDHSLTDRPLLRENPRENIERLYREREEFYRQCASDTVVSGANAARRVARTVVRQLGEEKNTVIESKNFDVVVGENLIHEARIATARARNIVVISQTELPDNYREQLEPAAQLLCDVASPSRDVTEIFHFFAAEDVGAADIVIAYGGHELLQIAAYAATNYAGGVPLIAIPTTLEAALCGAYEARIPGWNAWVKYSPEEVLCDLDIIRCTADDLAEAIALGFSDSPHLLNLATQPGVCSSRQRRELIEEALHTRLTRKTYRQGREYFTYGHALVHALEELKPTISHSHAVAFGMLFAAGIAEGLKMVEYGWVEQHRLALETAGIPTVLEGVTRHEIEESLHGWFYVSAPDRKTSAMPNRFMLLTAPQEARVVNSVSGHALDVAFRAIGLA